MKELPRKEFIVNYAKDKKLFQIIVRISDAPGSLSAVMDLLGQRVNLYGTTSYSLDDGTAIFSAFAEALSKQDTAKGLQRAIAGIGSVREADVREGDDGLLIDTFHNGLVIGKDGYLLLRRDGLNGMFDRIVQLFGSGGEVLLYEEGKAMGQHNAQSVISQLGSEVVRSKAAYLSNQLKAQGWGTVATDTRPGRAEFTIRVEDCVECVTETRVRKGCDFIRGYLEGSAEVSRGNGVKARETECRLRGGKACVFKVTAR